MKKKGGDPLNHCPICGARLSETHRCKPSVLAGIDGAAKRDPDDEEPKHISEGQRLSDGMDMLMKSGDMESE